MQDLHSIECSKYTGGYYTGALQNGDCPSCKDALVPENWGKGDTQTKTCPDCKDGFYYPFAGPREVCQTCFKKPNDINFVERVAAIFPELLFLDMGATKIKMVKTFNYHWQTFSVDLGCSKDHNCEVSLAQKAVDMMVHKLTYQYKQAIAFEDVSLPPPTKKDMIHLISNFSSVSALISMHETSIGPQFQFQVRVSL